MTSKTPQKTRLPAAAPTGRRVKRKQPSMRRENSFKAGNPYRWPAGVSGNPSGANGLMAGYYKEFAAAPCESAPGLTNGQAVVMAVTRKAQLGDVQAAAEVRKAVDDVAEAGSGEVRVYLGPDDYDPTKPAPRPDDGPAPDAPAGDA